ncbi:MAG: hypothetical protein JWO38_7951 [Gemmataceae bacterium]|nr:hypothetical protein [Gemmataceae bacterium]
MMPNDLLQLLTAAVDGELTPAEHQHVRRILADSAEARKVYAQLLADSARLRSFPVATPPADFRARVMTRLPKVGSAPTPIPPPLSRPEPLVRPTVPLRPTRYRSWVPLAVAASLLLTVSAGSFLFFIRQSGPAVTPAANTVAQADRAKHPRVSSSEPSWADILPRDNAPLPSVPPVADPSATAVATAPAPSVGAGLTDVLPPPRPIEPRDVLGSRVLPPIPPLDLVQVRVPFLASVADLEREDVRQKLADELGRDPALRIDLFVKDLSRGTELFQTTAKENGVTVLVDATAQERIKRKQATAYLIYSESLNPTELRDLFTKLAAEDAKGAQRVLDAIHVSPAQAADLKELKEVMGIDPGLWKHPAHTHAGPNSTDPKPLSAGTADQLAKALANPGGKPPEKLALQMTFSPAPLRTNPAASKELRQFFDRRGERKSTAVPVVLVVRQTNGG